MAHLNKQGLPTQRSLWSRKDSRRPGVVRVVSVSTPHGWLNTRYVRWVDTTTGREGEVQAEQWERRYRPYTAPEAGTPTAPPDEQEK